jgi:hypothetical protein
MGAAPQLPLELWLPHLPESQMALNSVLIAPPALDNDLRIDSSTQHSAYALIPKLAQRHFTFELLCINLVTVSRVYLGHSVLMMKRRLDMTKR